MIEALGRLPVLPTHACSYLPGRAARDRGFLAQRMPAQAFELLLEAGWRRAGALIYEPVCPRCRSCIPIRVRVGRFRASRSQRRVFARNRDLEVRLTEAQLTAERAALYRRYIQSRHQGPMTGSREELEDFLGTSPVDTCELEIRERGGRLLAIGTVDRTPGAWSCVYCYFEPAEPQRSLGTFNVLKTLELCRELCSAGDQAHLYLGYWVAGSRTMSYKAAFRPHEVRGTDGRWLEQPGAGSAAPS